MSATIPTETWPACPRGPDDDLFHEDPRPVCATHLWEDIVYLTGSGEFWLLNASAAAAMHDAADELADIAAMDDRQARNRRLSEQAGVLESFLPAHPVSFLAEDDRRQFTDTLQRLAALQGEDPDALLRRVVDEAPFQASNSVSTSQNWPGDGAMPAAVRTHAQAQEIARESNDHLEQLQALYHRGLKKAEEAGYVVDSGLIHGDGETRIREALQRYHEHRDLAFDSVRSHLERDQGLPPTRPLHRILDQYRRHVELCDRDPVPEAASQCEIAQVIEFAIVQLEQDYRDYIDSIVELAGLGVATPEFALAEDPEAGFCDGVDHLARYFKDLQALGQLQQEVDTRLREWEQGTARGTPLPVFLFTDEQARLDQLLEDLDRIHRLALRRLSHTHPRRVLHWDLGPADSRKPQPYQPRPIHRLVRADFPLREFTSPGRPRTLDHLSLHQLGETCEHYARQRDTANARDSRALATPRSMPDTALAGWLRRRGCQRIDWNPDWHDGRLGLFQPERFFEDLDRQGLVIRHLADQDVRQQWGERLRRILFADPLNHPMRLFDASGPAQLLRLLASEHAEPERRDPTAFGDGTLWLRLAKPMARADADADDSSARMGVQVRHTDTASTDNTVRDQTLSIGPSLALDEWGVTATIARGQDGEPTRVQIQDQHAFDFARGELALGAIHLPEPDRAEPVALPFGRAPDHPDSYSIGCYCLRIEPVLHGHAAVSVALGGTVALDTISGRLTVNGLAPIERQGLEAQIDAFAGTGLAAHNHCRLLWQPPKGLLARLPRYQAIERNYRGGQAPREAGQWKTLTTAEINPEVRAGVGGGAAFRIGLDNGRFVLHASLRLVLGVGGGGSVRLTLDPRHLDLWLAMLHQALVDVGYERVDWIDEDAFEQMSMLAYLSAVTLVDASLFLLRTTYSIRQWFERFTRRRDMASRIAYELATEEPPELRHDPEAGEAHTRRVRQLRAWVRQLPPEALGPLLDTLTSDPRAFSVGDEDYSPEQALAFHQQAILNCLQWIVSGVGEGVYGPKRIFSADDPNPAQKLFEKAVIRMGRDGRPTSESNAEAYAENRERLDAFMADGHTALSESELHWKYRQRAGWLSRHIE